MITELHHILVKSIQDNGPLSVDQFMKEALAHPEFGYYKTSTAIGRDGDFITAPEISQIFGELCGLWGLDQMFSQEISQHAGWAELGPGRGTLMADIIRVIKAATPNDERTWPVHLVDIHKGLKQQQREKLSTHTDLKHHDNLLNLPPIPMIFIANEFFDALPIRQFISQASAWYERKICVDNNRLKLFTTTKMETSLNLPHPAQDGLIAEYAPDLPNIICTISNHINTFGGGALIIDYGKDNAIGDSLQAVNSHKPVDIFHDPGQTDLSAWVDFSAIQAAAASCGAKTFGPQHQGDFLKQLGLYQRAEQLAVTANSEERRKIVAAVDRLSSPAQMGSVFKVMALLPSTHAAASPNELAGFASSKEMP